MDAAKHHAPSQFPFLEGAVQAETARAASLSHIYGSAAAIGRDLDLQMLSMFRRPPGLPSSLLGLRSLAGDLDACPWPELRTPSTAPLARAQASLSAGVSGEEELLSPFHTLHDAIERDLGLVPPPRALGPSGLPNHSL